MTPALEDMMKLQHPPNGHRLKEELAAEIARAEAAEKRVAELEAQRDDYHMKWVDVGFELGQFADDLIAVLKLQLTDNDDEATTLATIVTRVTELEAQLAAQEWQPVTEPPIEAGYYQTVNDGLYEHCYYGPNGWEDYSLPPTYWRPLTDPPLTGES